MLVLSRRQSESVVIGGADGFHRLLKVTVIGIRGGKVQLGFEVDFDTPIHPLEAWEQLFAEGRSESLDERFGSMTN